MDNPEDAPTLDEWMIDDLMFIGVDLADPGSEFGVISTYANGQLTRIEHLRKEKQPK